MAQVFSSIYNLNSCDYPLERHFQKQGQLMILNIKPLKMIMFCANKSLPCYTMYFLLQFLMQHTMRVILQNSIRPVTTNVKSATYYIWVLFFQTNLTKQKFVTFSLMEAIRNLYFTHNF